MDFRQLVSILAMILFVILTALLSDTIILWENVFTIWITTQLHVFAQDHDLFNFDLIKLALVIKFIHFSFVFIFDTITGTRPSGLDGKIIDLSKFSHDYRTDLHGRLFLKDSVYFSNYQAKFYEFFYPFLKSFLENIFNDQNFFKLRLSWTIEKSNFCFMA